MSSRIVDCVVVAALVASLTLVMMMATPVDAGVLVREERAARNNSAELDFCVDSAPCGWAIYTPFTRRVEYFVKSVCICDPKISKCVRVSDDLSVSAYVYQCEPIS
ncbi:uncharacterized protein LOC143912737 [Arctopsyche grandis]|uniref:uncharacterized protein LOC143912737 n=1 Tax=Arctopsyche grandis TaxID=121162 RepID=UPI00406D6675